MPYLTDIFLIGKADKLKGLAIPLRKVFKGQGTYVHSVATPVECEPRKYANIGGMIVDLATEKEGITLNSDIILGVKRLREIFPKAPLALRSNALDPNISAFSDDYELILRKMLEFDFALSQDFKSHSPEYIAQLLRNAFDRYNSLNFGNTILLPHERVICHQGKDIKLNAEQLNTLLMLAKRPWEARNIDEIHKDQISPTTGLSGTKKRVYTLRTKLKENDFPELIQIRPDNKYVFVPHP